MVLRCPYCQAPLEEEMLPLYGALFDCPECDRPVRVADLPPGGASENQTRPEESFPSQPISESPEEAISDTPPPGRLQCVQRDSQLILLILPGSNPVVRSLGCMAVMWLSIIGVMTGVVLRVGLGQKALAWEVLPIVVLVGSVFWAVGLGMLYFWLLGRFGKSYILLEPDRVVIRRVLFGRERLQEYPLDHTCRAKLVESYRQNDRPVHKVAIRTATGKWASFGTFLSEEEKRWLVARINRHLGVPARGKRKPTPPDRNE